MAHDDPFTLDLFNTSALSSGRSAVSVFGLACSSIGRPHFYGCLQPCIGIEMT